MSSITSSFEDDFDINVLNELDTSEIPNADDAISSSLSSNKNTQYITTNSSVSSYDHAFIAEENPEEISLPNHNHDMISAKAYLQQPSNVDGVSLYDHLSDILEKVITERPKNVIDFFEDYSRKMKEARFHDQTDHLQDVYVPPLEFNKAQKLVPLIKEILGPDDQIRGSRQATPDEEDADEDENRADMMNALFFFEQTGVGLPRNEMFSIAVALRKLSRNKIIYKLRFWGKILGCEKNYIIAETELTDEEISRRNAEAETREKGAAEAAGVLNLATVELEPEPTPITKMAAATIAGEQMGEGDVAEVGDEPPQKPFPIYPIPMSTYQEPPEPPNERSGEGVNKKCYFVCSEPGDEWIELPDVTPKQLVVARKIKKYFTGNLETDVVSYPLFPGKEGHYLRAQIARISSGTQVSPLGYYSFGGGEEEEEEDVDEEEDEGDMKNYSVNPNFEILPLTDLLDPSMSYWVHHTALILKQGRTVWWNPNAKDEVDGEEEEEEAEEEEKEEVAGEERQVGPPLLTPLSEDPTLENIPPWSTRASSMLIPKFAVVLVRSNLWPGAYSFAIGKKFENVYIGYGLKYIGRNYSPPAMYPIQREYVIGPEILEMVDPTPEEEEEWRIAHLPKPKPEPMGEEEQVGEEEEEEQDDDDDD